MSAAAAPALSAPTVSPGAPVGWKVPVTLSVLAVVGLLVFGFLGSPRTAEFGISPMPISSP